MNPNSPHKDREAIQTPELLVQNASKHCFTNITQSIPCAKIDFITVLLTLAVYCYFLLSLYRDREAIQTRAMLMRNIRQTLLITNATHAIPCAMSGFITVLLPLAACCYLPCIKIEKPYKRPKCLFANTCYFHHRSL